MTQKVLLVGLEYTGPEIDDVEIDTLGLCRPEIDEDRAAYAFKTDLKYVKNFPNRIFSL